MRFEGHQLFQQQLKTFLLFSCLMGDLFFVWTAVYQTCLMWACVPRLLSGLYQLFDLCLIKHVLTVCTLTLIVFGRQTFIVCPGPESFKLRHIDCKLGREHLTYAEELK